MKKYFKILGLEEDASKQEIEAAYNRLSKDLDPASNDNLDFFIEEYALVQEAYKKLSGKEIEAKITIEDSSTIDSFNLFDKDSTLISIIKKYRDSNNESGIKFDVFPVKRVPRDASAMGFLLSSVRQYCTLLVASS